MADGLKTTWRTWLLPLTVGVIGLFATLLLRYYAEGTLKSFSHSQATLSHQTAYRSLSAALERQETIARTLSQALAESGTSRQALAAVAHSLLRQYPELVSIDRYEADRHAKGPAAWRQVQRVTRAGALANPDLRPWAVPHWRAVIDDAWYQMQPGVTPLGSGDAFEGDNLAGSPTVNLFWPVAGDSSPAIWQTVPGLAGTPPRQLLGIVINPAELLTSLSTSVPGRPGPVVTYALYDLNSQSRDPLATTEKKPKADSPAQPGDLSYEDDLSIANRRWRLRTIFDIALPAQPRTFLQLLLLGGLGLTLAASLLVYQLVAANHNLNESRLKTLGHLDRKRRALQNAAIEKEVLGRALQEGDQRTRDFISLGESFCAELDDQGCIGFVSPQIAAVADRDPGSLANRPFSDLLSAEGKALFESLLREAESGSETRTLETRVCHADGSSAPVTLAFRPVLDPLGRCQGFRVVGRRSP